MKSLTIAGRLGGDAEVRRTQGGDAVTSFSVAVDDRTGKEKPAVWFRCSLWGKRGESLAQYLTKASKVAVSGELSVEVYEGKTQLNVRAEQVTLLGGGQDRDEPRRDEPRRDLARQAPADLDDSIPF